MEYNTPSVLTLNSAEDANQIIVAMVIPIVVVPMMVLLFN